MIIKLNLLFSLEKSKLNLFRGLTLLYSVVKHNSIFRKALDKNKIKLKIKTISLRKN